MTEETETEQVENTPSTVQEAVQEQVAQEGEEKPRPKDVPKEEWERVDIPEELQPRFNRLYRQVKESKSVTDQLVEDNRKLIEKIDKLQQSHDASKVEDTLSVLNQQLEEAVDLGDTDAVKDLTNKIAEQKIALNGATPAPDRTEPESGDQQQSGPRKLDLTPEQEMTIQKWAFERDDQGNMLRPWSIPGDPGYDEFLKEAQVAAQETDDVEEALEILDSRFKAKRRKPTAASVLSGNTSQRPAGGNSVELSAEQRKVAVRMFGSSSAMKLKDSDAIEMYRKTLME